MFRLLSAVKQIILFCYFIVFSIIRAHKFPYFDKHEGERAMIMGNGPSLKDVLQKYNEGKMNIIHDSFFVNYSPLDETFYKIKPNHYFLSDFAFIQDTPGLTERVRRMYNMLQEKVDWDLNVYLNLPKYKYSKQLIDYSHITNPHIHFVFLNRKHCNSLARPLRNWLYKKGWCMPVEGTVINTAIYVAILEGYKRIELYGVEHDMFKDVMITDDNVLVTVDRHFYGAEKKPRMRDGGGSEKLHEFLFCVYHMLHSHYLLRQFADYMGARVINCTPGSMIDSYERKKMES